MIHFQQRARTLTLPENFGERLILAARMAVSEHLRQSVAAADRSRDAAGHRAPHGLIVIGGDDHDATAQTRFPGTEAA